jgi:hypothetical protein
VSDASQELIRDIRLIHGFPNFSRNTRPNRAQYIDERPEAPLKAFGSKKAKQQTKKT